jgi:hypothetical protein
LAGRISRTDNGHQNVVLTFNYDLLLETSLARLGIPFSYGLGNEGVEYHESANCAPGDQPGTLKILKLHGSLNWSAANERLRVLGSFDDVVALRETAQVVPPTWDKSVSTSMRHVWGQAVEALRQATRVIVIGFSFRAVDAHFKYLLAAGLALCRDVDTRPHVGQAACAGPSAITIQFGPLCCTSVRCSNGEGGSKSLPGSALGMVHPM